MDKVPPDNQYVCTKQSYFYFAWLEDMGLFYIFASLDQMIWGYYCVACKA